MTQVPVIDQSMTASHLEAYKGQIENALQFSHKTHTYDDVVAMIEKGEARAWWGGSSIIITEIIDYPGRRAVNVFLAGGNLHEIEQMIPYLEMWARDNGCTLAMMTGRKGWGRALLGNHGWDESLTMFTKDLN